MSTLIDEETIVLEALDFEVPCSTKQCDHAAAWALSAVCCGISTTKCEHCQEVWKAHVESKLGTPVQCGECGHRDLLSWAWYRVVPL